MDINTATPVEIDTALAAHWEQVYSLKAQAERHWSNVEGTAAILLVEAGVLRDRREKPTRQQVSDLLAEVEEISHDDDALREAYGYYGAQRAKSLWRAYTGYTDAHEKAETVLVADIQPLDDEYDRRGGWNRAFLVVTNGRGHVHSSMRCSTCYASTRFHWVTEYSNHSETQIVEAAGERACTVCYPSAPVEVLNRPTQMFSDEEREKQRAREEREKKRAEREAEAIVVDGYIESGREKTKTFKSERAATNAISGELGSLVHYGNTHPSSAEWLNNVEVIRKALAEKGVEYDYPTALDRARKRFKRENPGYSPNF